MIDRGRFVGHLKSMIIYLALGSMGIIMALFLIEIGLRLVPRDYLDTTVERTSWPQWFKLNSQIGWVLRSHVQGYFTTKEQITIPFKTNSLGLQDNEHTCNKPADTFRVLIIE